MSLESNTRTVPQQIISGLKISAVLVALGILLLISFAFIPARKIDAYYWHIRHGTSVRVGRYRFPAPKQWYVERQSADDVLLVDLNTGDSISVRMTAWPKQSTLAAWSALTSRPTPDGGTKILELRGLQVGGEVMVCIEKNIDTKALRLYPIECRSDGALEVTFEPYLLSAKDHDHMFYSLLQQIQRF